MSKDKYVMIATSVSGASGAVLRKYTESGSIRILEEKDFSDGSIMGLIKSGFIKVASDDDIKVPENKELPNDKPKPTRKELAAKYLEISGIEATSSWAIPKLEAEIKIVQQLKEEENSSSNEDS